MVVCKLPPKGTYHMYMDVLCIYCAHKLKIY
jgi:hypothetical protein